MTPEHGGPGARGRAPVDFSTNAHAGGPCPQALALVLAADAQHYPDASYQALRSELAAFHGVAVQRVLLAASASEFIQRITAVGQRLSPGPVAVPLRAYGDYARAAHAWGRALVQPGTPRATLRWHADPGSPAGQDDPPVADEGKPPIVAATTVDVDRAFATDDDRVASATVLDAVYAPLRLSGCSGWHAAARDHVFVLHSPNKALGLCGVRAAYAIAPAAPRWQPWLQALASATPSWPLGGQGVALLQAWCRPAARAWLDASLPQLRQWKAVQVAALQSRGCQVAPGHAPFFAVRPPAHWDPAALWQHGVQVRDASSLGLPGWWRVNTLAPLAQAALWRALDGAAP